MGISNIQSGYSNISLLRPNTQQVSKNSTIALDIFATQNANASGTKEENVTPQQATSTQSLLSSQTNAVLLKQQEASPSGLHGIAHRYDVTNLSGNERVAMAQELRDNDLISAGAHLALAAPLSIDENLSTKTNYLNTAREAFEFASKHAASADQLAIQKDRLDILEKLQALQT